ncbi:putative dna repair protein [Phaeomoniella chlamydospora]|uniref:Putative dna repair protein n=1 Tax=Phaeomoniella chlamydospora TaxID=158046 RepID=A0A0G2DVB1_PHACM|nr:putative dna repair protein [Phaeomoniella chlamydospora]
MRADGQGRSVKRRRVGEGTSRQPDNINANFEQTVPEALAPSDHQNLDNLFEDSEDEKQQQIVYDDLIESDQEDEKDEDEDFEDVDLEAVPTAKGDDLKGDLDISLKPIDSEKVARSSQRKAVSAGERQLRLTVHKAHVLCFLAHVKYRNEWCNDIVVQDTLKPLVPRKIVNLLHVGEDEPQFRRDHSWHSGVEECCRIWKERFVITSRGIRRAWWKDDTDITDPGIYESETLFDKDDFRQAARTQTGSRDIGAQLFCALLRSVAVEARLVCSLQILPFSGVAKGMTPQKPGPTYIHANDLYRPKPNENVARSREQTPDFHNPRRRLGYPALPSPIPPARNTPTPPRNKKIVDSPYPIFWVEVFNETTQKWIPLDPIVRHTINKPKTGFEPPASDRLNNMSYVIAFEEDGTAKDVTLRYTRHYNAKTRKTRVESTKGGNQWWDKVMSHFAKAISEARDEVEDAELAAREAAEEMPRNVQDFKGHPHYALERHLRRNEAIWPLKEVGKVSPGMGRDAKLESIYRRSDVHIVRSTDQWYRKGRDVKVGEQPLKRVIPKRKKATEVVDFNEEDEDLQEGTRLYAEFQTEIYIPPPVAKGRVPKNAYGNIDVYVRSMIPPGGIHIQHPESVRAAKTLGIDYADAVTGFEFKGRQGRALVKGIVTAAQYEEAITEVLRSFNEEKARTIETTRTLEALAMWNKFLIGLRVKERVKEYQDETQGFEDKESGVSDDSQDEDYEDSSGGFFPDDAGGFIAEPTAVNTSAGFPAQGDEPHYSSTTLPDHDEQMPNWRTANIDLDTDIVIIHSPHTSSQPSQPHPIPNPITQPPLLEKSSSPARNPKPTQEEYNLVITSRPTTSSSLENTTQPQLAPQNPPPVLSPPLDSSNQEPIDNSAGGFIPDDDTAAAAVAPSPKHPNAETTRSENRDSESEIEKGSLLSEDPEDLDADPEWLLE